MSKTIVIGGGVIGCLAAMEALSRGHETLVFEAAEEGDDGQACSFAAGGMLSPVSELEQGEPLVYEFGADAVERWRKILRLTGGESLLGDEGGLYTAHKGEEGLLQRTANRIQAHFPQHSLVSLTLEEIEEQCPGLSDKFSAMYHFSGEGFLDAQHLIPNLRQYLAKKCQIHYSSRASQIGPRSVTISGYQVEADLVVDARGMGAQDDLADLRGVRGEAIMVRAPSVSLTLPLRILHARTPIYIVPRSEGEFYVGASSLESNDAGPITLRSALEIMSALYPVHSGFKEATITRLITGVRPALPSNFPEFKIAPGYIWLNGFYRNGFLLGPAITAAAMAASCEGASRCSPSPARQTRLAMLAGHDRGTLCRS